MELTKEQLIEHVEGVIHTFMEAVVLYPDNAGMKMDLLTAEIALAALKAKPVPGLFIKCTEIEPFPGKEAITQATPMENGKYHESCFRLYAAPPALEPMKDHQIRELVNELRDIAAEYHGTQQLRERLEDACRTAMLQGADGSSPVIPGGWVACSERLPEGMQTVITSNGFDIGQGWWDGEGWNSFDSHDVVPGAVSHWMPLPAAPQQEVK